MNTVNINWRSPLIYFPLIIKGSSSSITFDIKTNAKSNNKGFNNIKRTNTTTIIKNNAVMLARTRNEVVEPFPKASIKGILVREGSTSVRVTP